MEAEREGLGKGSGVGELGIGKGGKGKGIRRGSELGPERDRREPIYGAIIGD